MRLVSKRVKFSHNGCSMLHWVAGWWHTAPRCVASCKHISLTYMTWCHCGENYRIMCGIASGVNTPLLDHWAINIVISGFLSKIPWWRSVAFHDFPFSTIQVQNEKIAIFAAFWEDGVTQDGNMTTYGTLIMHVYRLEWVTRTIVF